MFFAHPRIVQRIVLVIIFYDRAGQRRAFLDSQPLAERACGDVSHDDFERNDLYFLDELLAHVEAAHEMGRHADRIELRHQIFADAVIEHTLALDHRFLGGVESRGVVLEVLDNRSRLGALVEDFGLALVDHAPAFHRFGSRPEVRSTLSDRAPDPLFFPQSHGGHDAGLRSKTQNGASSPRRRAK